MPAGDRSKWDGTGVPGWAALGLALLAAIPLGANQPVSWMALSILALALLALGLAADLRAPSARLTLLWPSAVLVASVLVWGAVQTSPVLSGATEAVSGVFASVIGVAAPHIVHPVWSTVEVPGTISADPIDGRHAVLRLAAYAALFYLGAQAGRRRHRAHAMLAVAAAGVALVAAFGLFAAVAGYNPVLGERAGPPSATFVNRNTFATYAAFGLVMNLALLVEAMTPRREGQFRHAVRDTLERLTSSGWIPLLGFAVCATALLGTQSRGGLFAAGAGVAFVAALTWRRGGRNGPVALVIMAVAAFVAVIAASGVADRLLAGDLAGTARGDVYRATLTAILDRPVLGHGLGAYADVFRAYVPANAGMGEWEKAHNTYLELMFELGVPAAIALLAGIALVAARIFGAAFSGSERSAVVVAAAGIIVVGAVHSLVDFSLQIPAVAALFAFALGLGAAVAMRPARARHTVRARPFAARLGARPA